MDVFRSKDSNYVTLGGGGGGVTDNFQVISADNCWDRRVGL